MNFDSRVAVYNDNGACPPLPEDIAGCNDVGVGDNGSCADQSALVVVPVIQGNQYLIRLGSWSGSTEGTGTITLGCEAAPAPA